LVQEVQKLGEARIKELSRTVLTKEARSEATRKVYEETNKALAEKYPSRKMPSTRSCMTSSIMP